jgi:hypothetical protein
VQHSAQSWQPGPLARLCLLAGLLASNALLGAPASAGAAPPPVVGAVIDFLALSPPLEAQNSEFALLAQSGATTVRLTLDWNRVEPEPGRFAWQTYDNIVDAARSHGLEVVLVLGPCAEWAVNPAWQVPPDQRRNSLPRSLDLWQRYVSQSVTHFRGRVRAWQVREQPNSRNFRGARSEYLRLLSAAASAARAADPDCAIILPQSGSLDPAAAGRLAQSPTWDDFDILGLYLAPTDDLSHPALAWAALTQEVLPNAATARRPPVWVLGGGPGMSPDPWIQSYLLAWAFGADRCYLPPGVIRADWTAPLSQLRYLGFLRLGPSAWALAFQAPDGPVVVAWSSQETELAASDLAPILDPEVVRQAAPLGGPPGAAVLAQGDTILLRLGPRPALIRGLDAQTGAHLGAPTRADVLAARPGPDLSRPPMVYADYAMPERPEFGLYHRRLRDLPGGRSGEETRTGRPCIRTRMRPTRRPEELDDPWLYFDVDDRWLYLARGETPIAITVECEGSFLGKEKLGFNIMYDSTTGYRFTPWQWVDPGYQWYTYRFEIRDASFANRSGWDFRINAKGSKQDLWIAAVTVEKLPPPAPAP